MLITHDLAMLLETSGQTIARPHMVTLFSRKAASVSSLNSLSPNMSIPVHDAGLDGSEQLGIAPGR